MLTPSHLWWCFYFKQTSFEHWKIIINIVSDINLNLKTMKEKMGNFMNAVKTALKQITTYFIIVVAIVLSYFIGSYTTKLSMDNQPKKIEVVKIKKSKVNLAVDENNHLIVINKETGDYVIYQDSIGKTIFKLYAKNVWGQHSTLTNQ